jgi:hypothetical protein
MVFRRVVLIGLFVGVGACTTVRRVEPAALLADDAPWLVWVTRTNNSVVAVTNPTIRRDTLRGRLNGERVRIPLSDVQSVQAKFPAHGRTALLVTTLGVVAVSTIYVTAISQAGGPASNGNNCGTTVRGDPIGAC